MAHEPSSPGFASGGPSSFNDKLSAAATESKARAADLGHTASDTTNQARATAAAGLRAAAGAISDNADELPGGNRARRAAHRAANALSSGAEYVRDNGVRDMMDDAMGVVKNNPGAALLGAVAIGFLVGRALSSRN
jgi:hypothetical protein